MATTPNFAQSLFTVPFSATTDFTLLAQHCEVFAQTLVECDDPTEKMALCGRLGACLALLQPTLNEPVPPELVASLTLTDLPTEFPAFAAESDQLAHYCQMLTQLLMSHALPVEMARAMEGLLCDLVAYFAQILTAPRWIATPQGRVFIDDILG